MNTIEEQDYMVIFVQGSPAELVNCRLGRGNSFAANGAPLHTFGPQPTHDNLCVVARRNATENRCHQRTIQQLGAIHGFVRLQLNLGSLSFRAAQYTQAETVYLPSG